MILPESIFNVLVFLILFYLAKNNIFKKDGNIALCYLFMYSLVRIFVEHFRIDSVCYIFGLPVAMVVSAGIIILSIVAFIVNNLKKKEI